MSRHSLGRSLLLLVVAACGKPADAPKPDPAATGSGAAAKPVAPVPPDAASPVAAPADAGLAAVDGAPAAAAAAGDDKLPAIGKEQALVFADDPGGTVTLELDDGKQDTVLDGTVVDLTPLPPGTTSEGIHVKAGSRQGVIETAHIITATELERNATGDFAVVHLERVCPEVCIGPTWLLRGAKQRWQLFDNVVVSRVAWSPDGTEVAVDDSRTTVIIQLPSGMVLHKLEKYSAPAYAPDGTLYVRNQKYGVFTVTDGKAKRVGKTKDLSGPVEEGTNDIGPDPVKFDARGKWKAP